MKRLLLPALFGLTLAVPATAQLTRARGLIRQALESDGVADEIEAAVSTVLGS